MYIVLKYTVFSTTYIAVYYKELLKTPEQLAECHVCITTYALKDWSDNDDHGIAKL